MSLFYQTDKLSLSKKYDLIKESYSLNYRWWVDHLDCSISWQRQKVEMDLDTVLKKLDNESHFTVILRTDFATNSLYGEVGFVSQDSYYLWIYISDENLLNLTKKYGLDRK